MSQYLEHIDPDLPNGSGQWLASVSKKEEFFVPENYFGASESLILFLTHLTLTESEKSVEFQVPENYFGESESRILSLAQLTKSEGERTAEFPVPEKYFDSLQTKVLAKVDELSDKVDNDFFEQQQNQILSRINLEVLSESNGKNEFSVPENYFESTQDNIISAVAPQEDRTPVIPLRKNNTIRIVSMVSIAASIAALLFFNFPDKPQAKESFAELLQKTELDDNDLDYIITEPEDIELIMDEITDVYTDTNSTDSIAGSALEKPVEVKPKLDPKTGLPLKDNSKIKPSGTKNDLKLDELSDEEIMDFLLEDGGDDILNELN